MKQIFITLVTLTLMNCASYSHAVMDDGRTRKEIPTGDLCIQGDSLVVGRTAVMPKYGIQEIDRMDGGMASLGGILGWFGGELVGMLLGAGVGAIACPKDKDVDDGGLGSEEGWCKVEWMMGGAMAFIPAGVLLGSEVMGRETTPMNQVPSCEE